jgi:concentrative nucleoside transporter, CNT family
MALRGISALGLLVLIALAWSLSDARRKVRWPLVFWGMGLQFFLALLILRTPVGQPFFGAVKSVFDLVTEASNTGAAFLFGNLTQVFVIDGSVVTDPSGAPLSDGPFFVSAVVAFNMLPVIIFVAGLSAILQHLGIIQAVVRSIAWVMRRSLKTSGAETFGAALLVFVGIESVSALGGYLKTMTRSEIFTLLVGFLATIAASVMVAYAAFGAEPGHLLAASLMSAPAALVFAKILVPEIGHPQTSGDEAIEIPVESHNIFDAAARGASQGLTMALNVGALLIVFIGVIHVLDVFVTTLTPTTLTGLMGWVMRPFAFIMGVPRDDIPAVAELIATKSVFNEFIAYSQISSYELSPRAHTITTYALCGFANPGSLGIMIGGMAALVPERRAEIAQLSLKAFIGGTFAAFSTACVAGILL